MAIRQLFQTQPGGLLVQPGARNRTQARAHTCRPRHLAAELADHRLGES